MTPYDDLLLVIQSHPQFKFLIETLHSRRPIIPAHDPREDNTDWWKQSSAQRAGYDLCLSILKLPLTR